MMEKIIVEKESSQVKMPPSFSCFHQCAWVLLILFGLTGTLQAPERRQWGELSQPAQADQLGGCLRRLDTHLRLGHIQLEFLCAATILPASAYCPRRRSSLCPASTR